MLLVHSLHADTTDIITGLKIYKFKLHYIYIRFDVTVFFWKIYIDGHESKPDMWILTIVQDSQQTSYFCSYATYPFHVLT